MIEFLVGETVDHLDISEKTDRILFYTKKRLGILTLPTEKKKEEILYGKHLHFGGFNRVVDLEKELHCAVWSADDSKVIGSDSEGVVHVIFLYSLLLSND